MNKENDTQVVKKESMVMRLLTAVLERTISWLGDYPAGVGTPETMMFMNYIGLGLEEAITYQSLSRFKQDQS